MSKDCTIQDVFHRFYPSFESTHSISPAQRKAAYHIMNCKTGAFGVNVSVCEDCGCISVHYNSCRDRCCPMCQEFPKEKWVDARREDILDAPYFHVVFTVPEELNPIIYSNQKFLYTALYHAASDTLSELAADSKYLGTDIGYICILHTWGSTMNFHPHIHAIVLGGGLDVKNHWKDNGKEFFLPIKVISKIFRGKYMAELKQLWENDRLEFHGSAANFDMVFTAGPYLAYGVNGKRNIDIDDLTVSYNTFGESKIEGEIVSGLRRFDAGVMAGVALDFKRWTVGLDGEFGCCKLASNSKTRNLAFFFTAGYKF